LKVISRLRKLTDEVLETIQFQNCYNVQITKRKKERKKAGKKERQKEKYTSVCVCARARVRARARCCCCCETLVKFVLQCVSGGIVNILGGGSPEYSE